MIFYNSIDDIPVYNWFKCIEKSEFQYVLKEPGELTDQCKEAFDILYCEFIDRYGINENLAEIIRLQNKILINKIDLALTGDKGIEMFIEIDELELKNLLYTKHTKQNSAKIAIEKYMGIRIDLKVTTVTEYYDYLEELKNNGRG